MSKPLSIRVRVALQRARMVARGDLNRSVQILLDARVNFAAAVRFSLAAAVVATLTACGGGALTAEEIAQHDADVQALHNMTAQPVACTASCK